MSMQIKALKDFVTTGTVPPFPESGTAYYFDKERVSVNFARLLPGHFYTFVSAFFAGEDEIPSLDEYQTKDSRGKKPYFDRRPIFISLGQEGPMEVGLNVKLMPSAFRMWFLRRYIKYVLPSLEKVSDKEGDLLPLNQRLRSSDMSSIYRMNRSFASEVSAQTGFNLMFLVDKYTRGEMGNPLALIDWDQIPKLCNLSYMTDGSIISKTPVSYFLTKFT